MKGLNLNNVKLNPLFLMEFLKKNVHRSASNNNKSNSSFL